jgi:hypothetical protein
MSDGVDYSKRTKGTIADFMQKRERMRAICEKVGRNFEDLSWSTGINVAVLGEDNDDFENRKHDVISQE